MGCASDYALFQDMLEPLLERIHRATEHTGKRPRAGQLRAEIEQLRQHLEEAVSTENYEKAAQLRDRIRQMEHEVEGTRR